ncbi:glycosyltransferase [Pedobacter aquae]|jgi:spore maturation protein CgeB|uniref:Glycosyltransferase n=1 Tax=Pedobacter aquae TaxID=2605747 RepID=A0A5C0VJF2_9SPHI|nr:glycosyltransferase [Pedobacter aquae]QEK52209.1 glycosyltransferase [Pedobacter aquae]
MKVALIGNKGFDTIEYHTADALKHLGHHVYHVDMSDQIDIKYLYNYWFSKFIPHYVEYLFNNLAKKIISYEPDLVIGTYRFIPIVTIQKIKAALNGIPIVQLNPDALTTFEKQQIFYSPYDFFFTKDPYIVDFMKKKASLNAHYLPEAFNQRVHKMPKKSRTDLERDINIDVLAFGSIYPYRARLLKKLISVGLRPTIFGDNQTKDQELKEFFKNEWITGDRKSEVLVGAKIVFNNFHYAEIDSVNCKFFEIAGAGGFQICDWKPTINEYSAIDSSCFTFGCIDQAIEHINYYINKPALRYEMATLQREHFLLNHTYDVRVKQMLDIVYKC